MESNDNLQQIRRAADLGDREEQYRLGSFYEEQDAEQSAFWYRQAALQNHNLAIDKCSELGISLDNEITDKEGLRKELKCRTFPLNYLPSYKYTVICSNYEGKWILSKHKNRDTWETQGGHIEEGETPLEAAKRELYEESGIKDADVYPVCDYCERAFVRTQVAYPEDIWKHRLKFPHFGGNKLNLALL